MIMEMGGCQGIKLKEDEQGREVKVNRKF